MRGYYTADEAEKRFGVVLTGEPPVLDEAATAALRSAGPCQEGTRGVPTD